MLKKLGTILKKIAFAFGLIYGINIVLSATSVFIPINILTLSITAILGVPGLMSILAIFFIL